MGKWSDLADWVGPTVNQGGGMVEVRGVVLHIAEGSYEGTIAWQKNPSADVSSHFICAKSTHAAQMVDTNTTAWTQKAGNGHWLSIENEGFVPDKLTSHQIEFAAQILARAHREYGVPLQIATSPEGKGLGHHSMGSHPGYADDWGHSACPGSNIINQKSAIVARAKEIVEGNDMTAEEIRDATWRKDGAVDNDFDWRTDSPEHTPPGDNVAVQGQTAIIEAAKRADLAYRTAQKAVDGIAEIKAMLTAGVEVSPVVKLDAESVAAVADATADEIAADPERDGV